MTTATEPTGTEWEELLDAGIKAAKEMDSGRWELGDIARKVAKRYGKDSLGIYASAITVNTDTLRDYRRVASFYKNGDRNRFSTVSWTHYRMAMRLKTPDAAMAFLETCEDGALTIAAAADVLDEKLGKPKRPKKLFDGKARISRVAGKPCIVIESLDLLPYVEKVVHLVVKEELAS